MTKRSISSKLITQWVRLNVYKVNHGGGFGPSRKATTTMKIKQLEKAHTDKQAEQLLLPPDSETVYLPTASLLKPDQAPQRVFGCLVKIATRILEAYFSDLYYDAEKVKAQDWENEVTLYYAVGDCGTNLEGTLHDIELFRKSGRPHVYQVLYRRSETLKSHFALTIRKIYSPEDK